MIRKEFTISGKVQGVYFRASTREQALILHLSGHAANLADGCVHVQAQGDAEALDRLEQWLQRGPPKAKVVRVECVEIDVVESEAGFRIR
ncbi:MAG: acylphosphatase [Arenimonas sp.]